MNRSRIRNNRRAFTLVELLVVVLILAILMAVALPLYLGAIASSEKGAARANMQTIANANQSYRLKNNAYTTDMTLLKDDLGSASIKGPGNRTYTIQLGPGTCDHDGDDTTQPETFPTGSFSVQSSTGTDGCFIPGVSTK